MSSDQDDRKGENARSSWSRIPIGLKCFFGVAIVSYGIQMIVMFVPPSALPISGAVAFVFAYLICPLCIFMPAVDPTLATMAFFVGPINAAIHAAIGGSIIRKVFFRP